MLNFKKKPGILPVVLICVLCASSAFSENLVVIVNENSPLFAVKKKPELEDIKDVCLGKTKFWGNDPVKPVNQKDRKILENFVSGTCGMKLNEYQHYWTKKMLNDGVRAPLSLETSADVIKHVQKEKGGIGYVLESEVQTLQGVKTIYVISFP